MKKITWLLRIVGGIQITLGVFYLFFPDDLLASMGHSVPAPDIHYPLAMLASRFLAYGIGFIYISGNPLIHRPWLYFMVLIQAIDLGAGVYYTATGVVDIALSGFPMFNALWIGGLLLLWAPEEKTA